jgi:predicted short-subunit dehydrogenase-like oxidoreductase (DUF2520 family)
MKIIIIGTGNAAFVLGRKIRATSHEIIAVAGRNSGKVTELAQLLGAGEADLAGPFPPADICLLCVTDEAISLIADDLRLPAMVVAHCAGSVPRDILKNSSDHYGVFYPLQTLLKDKDALPEIPFCIHANDDISRDRLVELASSISGDRYTLCDDATRLDLHIAAIFVNNFVNHLYVVAEGFCNDAQIDFDLLRPLIRETSTRLDGTSPLLLQTGPAIRRDRKTIERHLEVLRNHPQIRSLYEQITSGIQSYHPKAT